MSENTLMNDLNAMRQRLAAEPPHTATGAATAASEASGEEAAPLCAGLAELMRRAARIHREVQNELHESPEGPERVRAWQRLDAISNARSGLAQAKDQLDRLSELSPAQSAKLTDGSK